MAHCFIWKQAHTHTQYCITLQSLSGSGTGCRIREVTGDNLTSACHETGFKHLINRITTAKQKRCVMLPLVACQFAVVVPTPVYCAYCMSVVSPVGSFDSSSCCSLLRQFVFWHELSWFSRLFPPEWHCECFLFIFDQFSCCSCRYIVSYFGAPSGFSYYSENINVQMVGNLLQWQILLAFSLQLRALVVLQRPDVITERKNRLPLNKWVISVLALALKIPLQCILIFWWYFRVLSFPIHVVVHANIGAIGSPCLCY